MLAFDQVGEWESWFKTPVSRIWRGSRLKIPSSLQFQLSGFKFLGSWRFLFRIRVHLCSSVAKSISSVAGGFFALRAIRGCVRVAPAYLGGPRALVMLESNHQPDAVLGDVKV
jgi:hypothetical protein